MSFYLDCAKSQNFARLREIAKINTRKIIGTPKSQNFVLANNSNIKVVRDHRHFGITLTSDLNWSSHVQSLVSMASKRSGLLRLMSHQLPRAVTIRLFKSYVRPTMEYASAVWHGSLKEEDALSIERIQAGVARCLLKAEWCTPKPTLLAQLDWPALRWRREISSLTFFHKIIHAASTATTHRLPFSICSLSFKSQPT